VAGNPVALMATEIRDKLEEIINEFGDFPAFLPDPLERGWRNPVTDVRYDRMAELIDIVAED
jgi:hypothetical protein